MRAVRQIALELRDCGTDRCVKLLKQVKIYTGCDDILGAVLLGGIRLSADNESDGLLLFGDQGRLIVVGAGLVGRRGVQSVALLRREQAGLLLLQPVPQHEDLRHFPGALAATLCVKKAPRACAPSGGQDAKLLAECPLSFYRVCFFFVFLFAMSLFGRALESRLHNRRASYQCGHWN